MSHDVRAVYPAIHRITFSCTIDDDTKKVVQRWSWCKLSDVVDCLNLQQRGWKLYFKPEFLARSFGALCGRDLNGAVISYFVRTHNHTEHMICLHQPLRDFKGFPEGECYIPAGWTKRILDQTVRDIVDTRLWFPSNKKAKPKLIGRCQSGAQPSHEVDLPLRWCPLFQEVSSEP